MRLLRTFVLARRSLQRFARLLASIPVALVAAILTAAGAAVASIAANPNPHVPDAVLPAVVGLVTTVIGVGWAERRMGHARSALAVLVSATIAIGLHSTFDALDVGVHLYQANRGTSGAVFGPAIPAIGAAAMASAFGGPIARRRVRLLGSILLVMFVLYSGQTNDFLQLVVGVAGLVIGMLLAGERPHLRLRPATRREFRTLLAAIVAITALGPIVTMIAPSSHGLLDPLGQLFLAPLRDYSNIAATCPTDAYGGRCVTALTMSRLNGPGSVLLSLMPLLLLLLAARGIRNGRRVALWLAIGINLLMAVVGGVYFGLVPLSADPQTSTFQIEALRHFKVFVVISVLFPLAISVLLLSSIRIFPRDVARRAVLGFVGVAVLLLGIASALFVGVGWLLRDDFLPVPTIELLIQDLPERFFPAATFAFSPRDFIATGFAGAILMNWIGPLFWIVLTLLAIAGMRRLTIHRTETGPGLARQLVQSGHGGTISWMSTWSGTSYWHAPDDTLVPYRVVGNVAITTGEPLAPRAEQSERALQFATFCLDHGWTPVFYSVGDDLRRELKGEGWTSLPVGEEAAVHVADFTLTGKKMNNLRTALNRASREGTHATWTSWSDLSAAHASEIVHLSESWVAEKSLPELGFTLGGVDELQDPDVRMMLAVNAAGRVDAVTSWMPSYDETGAVTRWTLDFMRARADAPNGTMEFVIASSILRAQEHGPAVMSLSGAPLVSADETAEQPRITGFIAQQLEPLYGFRSLLRFKAKFLPTYERMWLVVPEAIDLPNVGIAIARAYLPTLSARSALRLLRSGSRA